jgi:hypothetical protein
MSQDRGKVGEIKAEKKKKGLKEGTCCQVEHGDQ